MPSGAQEQIVGFATEAAQPGRYPSFDGIRAIAALMVVVYHAAFFSTWFNTPGGTLLANLNSGVWIFFVTSGFLLYRPFSAAHTAEGSRVGLMRYAIRRVARIYPAYWLVLAFFTFVVPRAQIFGGDGFVTHATLTFTYTHIANPFLIGIPPAWSLVVEMTFYAFLPVYAIAIGFLVRNRSALVVELAGLIVLGTIGIVTVGMLANGLDAPWVTVLPQHLLAFALGMFLAVLSTHRLPAPTRARIERVTVAAWPWWTLALLSFVAMPVVLRVKPLVAPNVAQAIGLSVLQSLLGFFLVVPAAFGPATAGGIRRFLQTRVMVYLGTISYGIFLWHWFLLRIVGEEWLGWPLQKGNWVALVALTLPLILAAATFSWFVVEKPVLGFVHARTSRRPRAPSTPAPSHPA